MTTIKSEIVKHKLVFGNRKLCVPEDSYNNIDFDGSLLDSLSRINYQSIYIVDYHRCNFYYVNYNPLFLCGCPVEKVKAMGYDFYYKYVAEKDHQLLMDINKAGFEFYRRYTLIDNRLLYSISYDFHLTCGKSHILVNHQLTPWKLTDEGDIWLAICTVSLSSNKKSGNAIITRHDTNEEWKLDMEKLVWVKSVHISLTDNEKMVIHLSNQGMDTEQIAEKLNKSPLTIKEYRRNIFHKLEVNKISEAIAYCLLHKLI